MAKRRSKNKSYSVGRDVLNSIPIASRNLLPRPRIRSSQLLLDLARLTGQDDRRHDPIRSLRPVMKVSGRIASQTFQKNAPLKTARFKVVDPKRVTVCVRRGVRKEVLFSRGIAGRKGIKSRRLNRNSSISC